MIVLKENQSKIIEELIESGVELRIMKIPHDFITILSEKSDVEINFSTDYYLMVDGFFKSGEVVLLLSLDSDSFYIVDRYYNVGKIRCINDFLEVYKYWFLDGKSRHWEICNGILLELAVEKGIIKKAASFDYA
jgi:hypothetical protein